MSSEPTKAFEAKLVDARQSYPADDPRVLVALWNVAAAHARDGDFQEAQNLLEPMLQLCASLSHITPILAADFYDLAASVRSKLGDHLGAIPLLQSALEMFEAEDVADIRIRWALERLVIELKALGLLDEALEVQKRVVDWIVSNAGGSEREALQAAGRAARTLGEMGRFAGARDEFFRLLHAARAIQIQDVRLVVDIQRNIVEVSGWMEDWCEAAKVAIELITEAAVQLPREDDYGKFARRWRRTVERALSPVAEGRANSRELARAKRVMTAVVSKGGRVRPVIAAPRA